MDHEVTWSPEALEDIEDIAGYIAKDSPQYAESVVARLITASRNLSHLPLRGRVVPELGDEHYRECFIYSYRMIYWVEEQEVKIAAVIHGARSLELVDRFDG
ncbi:type II toxin-antitoxin system RelE/ParE family toxin [Porticoccus sp. GXU_MW_L64]